MNAVSAELRKSVRDRAGNRCEYCRQNQDLSSFFRFQIEHIVARQHGGQTVEANLAWSCQRCNLHKGPNLTGIDPLTSQVVSLFNPRDQNWEEHFEIAGPLILGKTPVGRTTVRVLNMNSPRGVEIRSLF